MSEIYFVSFADKRYAAQKRIKREAENMNFFNHIVVGDERIWDPWYYKKYKDRWTERGLGYWQWKSYLIRRTMDRMNESDYLIYADAGCTLNSRGIPRLNEYLKMVSDSSCGVLGFNQHFREADWSKADLFAYFDALGDSKYLNHGQVAATCIILQKKPISQRLIDEWFYIMHSHHDLASDAPSLLPNSPNFQVNRYDQSVFSLLMVKYGGVELPVEEIFTEGDWEELKDYPIWATRKRMKKRTWDKEIKYRVKKILHLTK